MKQLRRSHVATAFVNIGRLESRVRELKHRVTYAPGYRNDIPSDQFLRLEKCEALLNEAWLVLDIDNKEIWP